MKRNYAALCLTLICCLLPLSACGETETDSLVTRCKAALTAAQEAPAYTFSEVWTLEDGGKTERLAEMTVSKHGDDWSRTVQNDFTTDELQYGGVQYRRVAPEDWAPTALQEYQSFWRELSLDSFTVTDTKVSDDGRTISLSIGGEPSEDDSGNTIQLKTLEFVLAEDGSLQACREILRVTTLSSSETALRGILTVEVTFTDQDEASVTAAIEQTYQEANAASAALLPQEEDGEV